MRYGQSGAKLMSESPVPDGTQLPEEDQAFLSEVAEGLEPTPAEEQVLKLNTELEEARAALLRERADFVNYKRRSDQEREDMVKHLNAGLISKLLPVLDDFGMALDHTPDAAEGKAWAEGVGLINRKLLNILESEGAVLIAAEGEEFDPAQHEALGFAESAAHSEGQVVAVVRQGYTLNGRVLRPAQVILARNPEEAE